MKETDRAKTIITGVQKQYPKVYETIIALIKGLDVLDTRINEIKSVVDSDTPEAELPIAPNVEVFTYAFTRRNLILNWEQPDTSIIFYEIKKGGSNWETASHVLTTATLSAVFDPILVGTTRYWIKGIDFDGNVSVSALALDVNVPEIGSIIVTTSVIDNNILFQWTEPTSIFDIDYYLITKDATVVGKQKGTFAILFETVGGIFNYKIKAVDIAGNIGPEVTITVEVRQPPDFDLLASGIDDLSGVKVNTLVYNGKLLANVHLDRNWAEHFILGDT